jgi:hypothetical protein
MKPPKDRGSTFGEANPEMFWKKRKHSKAQTRGSEAKNVTEGVKALKRISRGNKGRHNTFWNTPSFIM